MGGVFGAKLRERGAPPPPPATPDVSEEAEDVARRRRPRGRRRTFLTGDLVAETGKKKVLG